MRLSQLAGDGMRLMGDGGVEIAGLCADSRQVRPGELFAAIGGSRDDGRRYLADALARGAVAVLGPEGIGEAGLTVPVVEAGDPRHALARMAARLAGAQPRCVVAVTGTNGKTSTAVFTRQLWQSLGHPAASLGTLGLDAPGRHVVGSLTTPDPITLHRLAAELAGEGVQHLAIEASSHGLDQRRLDGLLVAAGAFTNLTRDHFDYHGGEAGYLAAKRRLFTELLPRGGVAVLNADVPEFPALAADARARDLEIIDYGRTASRLRLAGQELHEAGQDLDLELDGRSMRVSLALVGDFQAWNALAALGLVLGTGGDLEAAARSLASLTGAPGRMELVTRHRNGAAVFVDYAHTPDALEKALVALRAHAGGRLVVVFGCGGDRDPGKRPVMGRIARQRADRVIVTDDNPRGEDPAWIRASVMQGAGSEALEIGDRAQAIATGITMLEPADVLLVAGKGHEAGQTIAGVTHPFDDATVCRAAARDIAA
ncbi:MAG TPA: UDP-N-acetylmuramoyl-L-alanyl-D-glutamate--2,6-diaminopimelate ligase [Geminicoccaceae bacterium]|nr:UDP-N-acetylmuramoyl-L-alanyl-D-glutamate--2,6-diaminopimelate ligase [Geminicoccus sp.]HMU50208.1 UDP-N-acetylmuramoyl-L-alanyl-D-glutamate--2,6-diaminopimelate ligase [Geminicoccaceae bacterium]